MFEKKLNPALLGKVSKTVLREFKNRNRMSEEQYATAVVEYNMEVDRRRVSATKSKKLNDILPMFIEEANDIIPMRKIQEKARALKGREDSKKYIQGFTLSGEIKGKDENASKWRPFSKSYTVIGAKSKLNKLVRDKADLEIQNMEELSPIVIRKPVITNTTLVQVGNKTQTSNIKMKNAGSIGLSNEDKQVWDTQTGKCVFDYLVYLYGETKGLKKIMNYENLEKVFGEDSLEEGVCVEQIDSLCRNINISYYALDLYENVIKCYVAPNCKFQTLIFRIMNGHLYPVEEMPKRKSIVNRCRDTINIKDKDVDVIKSKKEKKILEIVSPDEDVICNDFAVEYINKLNKMPYPIKSQNIYFEDGNIKRMIIDEKIILTEPIDETVKNYYGEDYQGQCVQGILVDLWTDTFKTDIYKGDLVSSFSPEVLSLLTQENIKHRTHFGATREINNEEIKDLLLNEGAVSCDIEKCYSSLLMNPLDDFMILDSYNEIEEVSGYDNELYFEDKNKCLPFGLYIVRTGDLTILHQSNVYSNKILDYAKQNNIKFEILYKILATNKQYKKYFHPFYENLKEKINDTKLIKMIMNTITGCLGKTYNKHLKVGLTTNLEEVWNKDIIKIIEREEELYFKKLELDSNNLYVYGNVEKTQMTSFSLPIYIQILDWSNIKLHQMITEMGGECIYRKTDCAVCIGGNQVVEMEKDPDNMILTWGSFRNEDITDDILNRNYMRRMKSDRHISIPVINSNWIIANFNSSNQWSQIMDYAIQKGGLFIDGRAGTGKTFVIKESIATKKIEDDKESRLAFTNKASRNLDGTTIHKALGISDSDKTNNKSMIKYQSKNLIVVDECGMIPLTLWKKLLILKNMNKKLCFIILGDKRQTKPIEDLNIDYFNSNILKHLVNFNKIELTERQRYDEELWNFLENYYENGVVGKLQHKEMKTKKDLLARKICYFNKTRDEVNDHCMKYLKPDDAMFIEYTRKTDDDGVEDRSEKAKSAFIYKDLPIMCIKNNSKLNIINTDEFKVTSYTETNITMSNIESNEELIIDIEDFHKNFVVNYISTTHKLQGSTITEDLLIFDWYPKYEFGYSLRDDKNVGYTALSRVKSLKQIYIIN